MTHFISEKSKNLNIFYLTLSCLLMVQISTFVFIFLCNLLKGNLYVMAVTVSTGDFLSLALCL